MVTRGISVAALIGMFLLCVLVSICYSNAERLARMLGKKGTSVLTRLSAFILCHRRPDHVERSSAIPMMFPGASAR